jgi:hypothetical protein
MKKRLWFALAAIGAACLITLGAVHSESVEVAIAPDATLDQVGNGKGKGPRCKHDLEVHCLAEQCEEWVCGHTVERQCYCSCVPIPDCVPAP